MNDFVADMGPCGICNRVHGRGTLCPRKEKPLGQIAKLEGRIAELEAAVAKGSLAIGKQRECTEKAEEDGRIKAHNHLFACATTALKGRIVVGTGLGETWEECLLNMTNTTKRAEKAEAELATLRGALQNNFPHFEKESDITTEVIDSLGTEWHRMVHTWAPIESEIKFQDGDVERTIIWEDYEEGSGWTVGEDAVPFTEIEAQRDAALDVCRAVRQAYKDHTDGYAKQVLRELDKQAKAVLPDA